MTTHEEYREIGKFIWENYVSERGQSGTVQGELLRANEKLRHEALSNANIFWTKGHEILAFYILKTLTESRDVPEEAKIQLKQDIDRVLDHESPCTDDGLFDRIERIIFDWYLCNREPIPREHNPSLTI